MNTDIVDFGAVADGRTLNTQFIQNAIDVCGETGGGRVNVPAGCFLSGTLRLRDNVELHLEHGSVLKASSDLNDYNETDEYPQNADCPPEGWCGKHFILAVSCVNVAITGTGTVEGAADAFFGDELHWFSNYCWADGYYTTPKGAPLRPGQLICFIECRDISVSDISIRKSTCWSLFFHGCDYVRVRGIMINNHRQHVNTDGIDVDCCSFVTIDGCIIDTGDDAIAIRGSASRLTDRKKACEYVTVSNCVLSASACGMRIGVGNSAIHHVTVSDIVIKHCGAGFQFMTTFNGVNAVSISDVLIHNVTAEHSGNPIIIGAYGADIRRVAIGNFTSACECGIQCEGQPGRISDISLSDVRIYDSIHTPRNPEVAKRERGDSIARFTNVQRLSLNQCSFCLLDDYFEQRSRIAEISGCVLSRSDAKYVFRGEEKDINVQ